MTTTHTFKVELYREGQAAPFNVFRVNIPEANPDRQGIYRFINGGRERASVVAADHIAWQRVCTCESCVREDAAQAADDAYCCEHDC